MSLFRIKILKSKWDKILPKKISAYAQSILLMNIWIIDYSMFKYRLSIHNNGDSKRLKYWKQDSMLILTVHYLWVRLNKTLAKSNKGQGKYYGNWHWSGKRKLMKPYMYTNQLK